MCRWTVAGPSGSSASVLSFILQTLASSSKLSRRRGRSQLVRPQVWLLCWWCFIWVQQWRSTPSPPALTHIWLLWNVLLLGRLASADWSLLTSRVKTRPSGFLNPSCSHFRLRPLGMTLKWDTVRTAGARKLQVKSTEWGGTFQRCVWTSAFSFSLLLLKLTWAWCKRINIYIINRRDAMKIFSQKNKTVNCGGCCCIVTSCFDDKFSSRNKMLWRCNKNIQCICNKSLRIWTFYVLIQMKTRLSSLI